MAAVYMLLLVAVYMLLLEPIQLPKILSSPTVVGIQVAASTQRLAPTNISNNTLYGNTATG
jgi:hypothetical protein